MKRSRGSMRRLFMQSLECRCVMDASGFEMGTEVFQDIDMESAIFQSAPMESADETSTDIQIDGTSTDKELVDENVEPNPVLVICDLPPFGLNEAEGSEGTSTDNELVNETVEPDSVMVICDKPRVAFSIDDLDANTLISIGPTSAEHETIFQAFDAPTQDESDLIEATDLHEVAFSIDDLDTETLISIGPSSAEHETIFRDFDASAQDDNDVRETIFQAFGATSQDDSPLVISPAIRQVRFNFDVDQSGSLSRLDAEMLISYLSDFFRSESFAAFAQSDASEMLQMDVDGDAQLTPLDALIVINELNRSGTLGANISSNSSGLDVNSTLIANGGLRIRDIQDDSGVDAAPIDDISSSVDDSTDVRGKFSIAPMRLSYRSLTLAKQDGTAFVLSVDDNGKVSAASDSQDLEVSIGEDQVISVDGESSGLAVVDFGGVLMLSKQVQADGSLMFA